MDVIANFFTSPFSQCSTAIDVSIPLLFMIINSNLHHNELSRCNQFLIHRNRLSVILGPPISVRQNSSKCLSFVSMFVADWISEI